MCIGVRIAQAEEDKAFRLLAAHRNVKFLWRTFGDCNISLVAFCPKGGEGEVIQGIRTILEAVNATQITV